MTLRLVNLGLAMLVVLTLSAHSLRTPEPTVPYCPVAAEVGYSNTYLVRRPGGRLHRGIDVFAQRHAPIVAPEAGTITFGFNRRGGTVARLQGDSGNYYYLAHLQDWATEFVQSGDHVEAGWVVAYVGNSGNASGTSPHLHVEVRINGRRVNPHPWLVQACSNKPFAVPIPTFAPSNNIS